MKGRLKGVNIRAEELAVWACLRANATHNQVLPHTVSACEGNVSHWDQSIHFPVMSDRYVACPCWFVAGEVASSHARPCPGRGGGIGYLGYQPPTSRLGGRVGLDPEFKPPRKNVRLRAADKATRMCSFLPLGRRKEFRTSSLCSTLGSACGRSSSGSHHLPLDRGCS